MELVRPVLGSLVQTLGLLGPLVQTLGPLVQAVEVLRSLVRALEMGSVVSRLPSLVSRRVLPSFRARLHRTAFLRWQLWRWRHACSRRPVLRNGWRWSQRRFVHLWRQLVKKQPFIVRCLRADKPFCIDILRVFHFGRTECLRAEFIILIRRLFVWRIFIRRVFI